MLLVLLGVALVTLVVCVWKYMSKVYSFWEERGVPYKRPLPFIGNSWDLLSRQVQLNEHHKRLYNSFPDVPYYGIYDYSKPILVVKDVDLVERVLIKDFQHFVDLGLGDGIDEQTNPLDINLFSMTGNRWRYMRNKLSPLFTTGKLRHMVPQMKNLGDRLVQVLEENQSQVDLKDMFQRYAIDVIASIAFGMNVNILQETEESEFRKIGKKSFRFTLKQYLRFIFITVFPKLAKMMRVPLNDPEVNEYFSRIIREALSHRKQSGMSRNDFVQLFVTLQQKGSIAFEGDDQDDKYLKSEDDMKPQKKMANYELTDAAMIGHAFVFLVAGFDSTSITMMNLCYELALNPEIQKKAREEIVKAFKNRGVLDYDTLRDAPYYGQCVQEVMRLHTIIGFLSRVCTKDYTFPGTSLSIKAGQAVLIPTIGIHQDPAYYENPDKFDPDRFAPDVSRKNCSFLAFGDGPRVCIAMRFAMTEIKLCVARLLLDYSISLHPKTKLPLEMDSNHFADVPNGPVYFTLTKMGDAL
uniref:Putative cytochrome P450 6a13 n=1 Tax=Lygus hesperus TaxID=30085 RepID=A0A0A9XVU1_LYGHE